MHCRLLGVCADGDAVGGLLAALREASRRDFVAEKLWGFTSHEDGWGYAAACLSGGSWSLFFHKVRRPIWDSDMHLPRLRGKVWAVFHARKASPGMPKNSFAAHPYPVSLADGCLAFVAQNGGISRKGGCRLLGKSPPLAGPMTDSFIYSLLLAKFYAEADGPPHHRLLSALVSLHKRLAGDELIPFAANTMVLLFSPGDSAALAVVRAQYASEYDDYYDIYKVDVGGGLAYASSTVALILEREGCDVRRIQRNMVVVHHATGDREGVLEDSVP